MGLKGGGGHLDWLVPLKGNGHTRQFDESGYDVIGNHKGDYAGLCVANPTPGTTVQWARNTSRSLTSVRQRGWRVIQVGDGPLPAYALDQDQSDLPTPLDTTYTFGGLVLVETSEANFRRMQEERDHESLMRLKGAGASYIQQSDLGENAHDQHGHSVRTRLVRRDHGILFQDGEDVTDSVRPEEEY